MSPLGVGDRMNARDRRALRLGLFVLAPALLWVWGVQPYRAALAEARDGLAVQREALAREQALLAGDGRVAALRLAADSAADASRPRLFQARDDLLASAELAGYLARAARANDVLLQEADTRPATVASSGLRTLQVEIRAESDLEGFLGFLQALEHGERLVRVERLTIARPGDADADEGDVEVLTLSATVLGYALAPDSAAASPSAPPARVAEGAR